MSSQKKNMGLKVLYDPENSTADLVLVHGLNGHPIDTWAYTEVGENGVKWNVCWPKDLLPKVQPRVRVLSFGYSGDIYENNSVAGIRGNAKALLVHLTARREDLDMTRPIVFFAHCLGGLIVKQAMCYADNLSQYQAIARGTRGLLFFGTPHFGAKKEQWLSIIEAMGEASAKIKGKPSTLVDDMTKNCRAVTAISEDFVHIVPLYEVKIKSAYETLELPSINQLVVPKMSTQMFGGVNEDAVPVDADHISMCKFSDEDDVDFEMVWKFIREVTKTSVERSSPAAAPRRTPEVELTGKPVQVGHNVKIDNFFYIDSPNMYIDSSNMRHHQRPVNPAVNARNDATMLPPTMESDEQFLIREAPLSLPAPTHTPVSQGLRKDVPVHVVTVECESESRGKQSRWFSRMMRARR